MHAAAAHPLAWLRVCQRRALWYLLRKWWNWARVRHSLLSRSSSTYSWDGMGSGGVMDDSARVNGQDRVCWSGWLRVCFEAGSSKTRDWDV